ncbi:hypothetical protein MRX96_038683 [Rhipicephalus microplus]
MPLTMHGYCQERRPLSEAARGSSGGRVARENVGRFPRCGALFLGLHACTVAFRGIEVRQAAAGDNGGGRPGTASLRDDQEPVRMCRGAPLPVNSFVREKDDGSAARVAHPGSFTSRGGVFRAGAHLSARVFYDLG